MTGTLRSSLLVLNILTSSPKKEEGIILAEIVSLEVFFTLHYVSNTSKLLKNETVVRLRVVYPPAFEFSTVKYKGAKHYLARWTFAVKCITRQRGHRSL